MFIFCIIAVSLSRRVFSICCCIAGFCRSLEGRLLHLCSGGRWFGVCIDSLQFDLLVNSIP